MHLYSYTCTPKPLYQDHHTISEKNIECSFQFDNSVYLHGNTRRGVFYTGGRWVDGNTRRGVYTGGRWEDGGITISVFTWTYEERSLLHCGVRWEDVGIGVYVYARKINYISNRYIVWKAEAETANPIYQIKAHHRSQRVQNWNVFHPRSNTDSVIYSHMAKVGTLGHSRWLLFAKS